MQGIHGWSCFVAAAVLSASSGCAVFQARPLPAQVGAAAAGDVHVDVASMPVQDLTHHVFDPRDGLDETETAMLAVANNPDLKVLRDALGIAHAQAFAAGLLPDPQLTASRDFVTGSAAGATSPFGLGISWDVGQLLTRSAQTRAAQWNTRQVDLNLLWAEWQTIAQARVLFARVVNARATVARLQTEATILAPLQKHIDHAVAAGNLSADLAVTGLSAVSDAHQKLTAEQAALNDAEHALLLLLGLQTQAPLQLVGEATRVAPDAAQLHAALADLPRRRPDLLALQAGYESQNQKLREAILKQFPAISVGFNRARDNSAVYTSGVSIGLTLPLFNRNRGNIAIEKATRSNLYDTYAARLLATGNEVDRLAVQLSLQQAAQPRIEAHANRLDADLRRGEAAFNDYQLDLPTYLAMRSNALAADLQRLQARQTLAETGIALQTLLGGNWSAAARATLSAHSSTAAGPSS